MCKFQEIFKEGRSEETSNLRPVLGGIYSDFGRKQYFLLHDCEIICPIKGLGCIHTIWLDLPWNKLNQSEAIPLKYLDPVVQSMVSLTSSLRGQLVKCFMTL